MSEAELKPVSFSRRQTAQPRLSAPYVPGVKSDRFWTDAERQVLRDHYTDRGFAFCAELLPNRTKTAIYGEAHKLGLGRPTPKSRCRDHSELDAALREAWPEMDLGRGAVKRMAARLGKPLWLVSDRLLALGLTKRHKKEPNWTPAEEELLKAIPLHDPDKAAEIFRAHGFSRSPASLMNKAKRLSISRRFKGGLSANAAAKMLGVDIKWITARIFDGRIKAERRGTQRLVQQGGDWHVIAHADLRRYVIAAVDEIDFRRVDKFALIELLTGGVKPDQAAAIPAVPARPKRRLIQPRRRQPRAVRRALERMAERRA